MAELINKNKVGIAKGSPVKEAVYAKLNGKISASTRENSEKILNGEKSANKGKREVALKVKGSGVDKVHDVFDETSRTERRKIMNSVKYFLSLAVIFVFLFGCSSIKNEASTNFITIPIPLGSYVKADISSSICGVATEKGIVGSVDNVKSFSDPHRYLAQLIWFGGDGYLEYRLKNPLPENSEIKTLRLFFEACSEAPGYDLNHKTDISVYINGKKIATHTINSDFGGKRGKYTPEWWPTGNSQYGRPIFVEVRKDGTYIGENNNLDWVEQKKAEINFQKASDIGIEELNLNQEFITIRIGVDKDAQNRGGMNLFGEEFGNYPKTLTLGLEYEGEKIYQPKIAEIIDNPEKYENKTVILTVHPGGWSCPVGKATKIPEGFSRSATMFYDDTGCLYGNGDILVGKILIPETHTIATPGNETIVIKGKVKLDKNKIPFISPLNEN